MVMLLSRMRFAVACTMLALLLIVPLSAAACEVHCIEPAVHTCCPMRNGGGHSVTIAGVEVCHRPASAPPADLVVPAGLTAGIVVFQPFVPIRLHATSRAWLVPASASPPEFHLRI